MPSDRRGLFIGRSTIAFVLPGGDLGQSRVQSKGRKGPIPAP